LFEFLETILQMVNMNFMIPPLPKKEEGERERERERELLGLSEVYMQHISQGVYWSLYCCQSISYS